MNGNFFTRSGSAIGNLIANPSYIPHYLSDRTRPASPIALRSPWFSWAAIDHLRNHVQPNHWILEWGGGGSSLFFIDLGANLVTIETHDDWYRQLRETKTKMFPEQSARWQLQNIKEPICESSRMAYLQPLHGPKAWDYVVVDGPENDHLSRMHCLAEIQGLAVKPKVVILDDAWRSEYSQAPALLSGYERQVFRSVGPARLGVTQTDIYTRK
jgi:hypothetical protein